MSSNVKKNKTQKFNCFKNPWTLLTLMSITISVAFSSFYLISVKKAIDDEDKKEDSDNK